MIEVFWSFCCCCCSCYCYCVSSFFLLHFLSFFPFVHVFVSFSCFFFFFFSSSSLMMIVVMAANWTNIEATLNSLELIWFVSNDHFNMFNPNMFITPSSTPNTTPKLWKSGVKDPKTPQKKKTELWTGRKIPGSVSQVYLFVLGNWWLSYTSIRYYTIMFPLAECALNLFAKCSLNRVRHQARVPCFAKLCCTKHLGMIWISICVWETFGVSDHYTNWKVGGAILTVSSGGAILTVGSGQSSKGLIISQCMSYCKQGVRWFCCIFF